METIEVIVGEEEVDHVKNLTVSTRLHSGPHRNVMP